MQKKDKLPGIDRAITPRDFVGSVLIEQKGAGGFLIINLTPLSTTDTRIFSPQAQSLGL